MKQAVIDCIVDDDSKHLGALIRTEAFAWSPNYEKDSEIVLPTMKVDASNLYIDSRAQVDYDAFSKYFIRREEADL
jgi:hypothetical protein